MSAVLIINGKEVYPDENGVYVISIDPFTPTKPLPGANFSKVLYLDAIATMDIGHGDSQTAYVEIKK